MWTVYETWATEVEFFWRKNIDEGQSTPSQPSVYLSWIGLKSECGLLPVVPHLFWGNWIIWWHTTWFLWGHSRLNLQIGQLPVPIPHHSTWLHNSMCIHHPHAFSSFPLFKILVIPPLDLKSLRFKRERETTIPNSSQNPIARLSRRRYGSGHGARRWLVLCRLD